jgi:hypothetical protein
VPAFICRSTEDIIYEFDILSGLKMYKNRKDFMLLKGYITESQKSITFAHQVEDSIYSLNIFVTEFLTLDWQDKQKAINSTVTLNKCRTRSLLAYFVFSMVLKDYLIMPPWVMDSNSISDEMIKLHTFGENDCLAKYFNISGNEKFFSKI